MKISICDTRSDAAVLARFFSKNVTPEYISHSELQGYRAVRLGEWAHDLEEKLRSEIQARLGEKLESFPAKAYWQGVVEARREGALVGLALVAISHNAHFPFGTIEDVIVEAKRRGRGDGEILMHWIIDNFERAEVRRIFLESGISNHAAHRFFGRFGFKSMSVTMVRESKLPST